MVLLDHLGRLWALRVLWELRDRALTFRALRDACDDISPSVLNARLRELRELDIIERTDDGYALTRHGRDLGTHLLALDAWARGWARRRRT
jgi:DNA-binding HxlR family transcriptional regulator